MMPHGILVLFTKNVHAPCFSDIHFVRHIGCNSEETVLVYLERPLVLEPVD